MYRKVLMILAAIIFSFLAGCGKSGPEQVGQPGGPVPHLFEQEAVPVGFAGDVLKVGVKPDGTVLAGVQGRIYASREPSRPVSTFPNEPVSIQVAPDGKWVYTYSDRQGVIVVMDEHDSWMGNLVAVDEHGVPKAPLGAFFVKDSLAGLYQDGFAMLDLRYGQTGWKKFNLWMLAYPSAEARGPGDEVWVAQSIVEGSTVGKKGEFYIEGFDLKLKVRYGRFFHDSKTNWYLPKFDEEIRDLSVNLVHVAGVTNNGKLAVYTRQGSRIAYVQIEGDASCIALHPSQSTVIVVGTEDGQIVLLQIASSKLEEVQRLKVGPDKINDAVWSVDGNKVIVGTLNKTVTFPFAITDLKKGGFGVEP